MESSGISEFIISPPRGRIRRGGRDKCTRHGHSRHSD